MDSFENLISDFINFRKEGLRVALVTLIDNNGSSPRPLGSQMVVAEDSQYAGHLTGGGCAESVIVAEAVAAMAARANRLLRLGAGSPYIDIQLPCGAGIDIYIDVDLSDASIWCIDQALQSRQPIALDTDLSSGNHHSLTDRNHPLPDRVFRRWYIPRRRVLIMGKGYNTPTLGHLAAASDYEVLIMSPDQKTLESSANLGLATQHIAAPSDCSDIQTDAWTAAVLLFHEHEREPGFLKVLLRSNCFYIGALGSHRTHEQRVKQLKDLGFDEEIKRIHSPAGLDIKAKAPAEIAISILAEMTQVYHAANRSLLQTNGTRLLTPASESVGPREFWSVG
ncbi:MULTISPECIES: XdhC family protein [unclassified Marinobacter]|jgi:xanthine dehydrogenase accessory factor|uniref:XdhC family protein n=1 Tax=unclassified Marinobacter TaxID=83889 RepID=UPI00200C82C3|nr:MULTISPECIES: XdhC family protein [unclassified Marinobacter]MCL1481455.1 XdhC family protein [Marinobacter sp.]UQG54499.1 XdhC family protein [Marinobacter sp. M4C]UQG63304.1 XdhC family protein [Marinobacter sp. M2C]UQG67584.1 XdhC family protein [Marinobacter sp. M1C]